MGKMKNFKELTKELEEAVMKRLDLAKLRKRSKEQSIRMRRLMKNPAYKKKIELKKKRMKSTPELLVRAQKKARDTVRKKFYPKYDEMGREGKAKINQMVSLKHGPKISKIAKKLLPKIKIQSRELVKRARELSKSDPDA
jgi:hypothetical protein|tara:strand:+ start:246 stop:665 length:420 start_codon:yes stop_codon:yes gene_type:complete